MVKKVKARLILTGRSSFPTRDQWKKWLETHAPEDSTSRKIRKIQELEKRGGEVLICKADVSNPKQMQAVIELAEKRLGTINGVIHSAGVPDGRIIQLRTRETTESILAAKVTGTLILDEILNHNHETFDFMIKTLLSHDKKCFRDFNLTCNVGKAPILASSNINSDDF